MNKNAGDDIVIAAALRTKYNIEEARELDVFIRDYRPGLNAGDYVGTKRVIENGKGEIEVDTLTMPGLLDNPEDLGPVPKKLGVNGQAIQKLMKDKADHEWTVDGLHDKLKIPKTAIKPMLALLLERNIIKRVTNYTYQII